ncbi:MAG: DUF1732 domain-containing protein [Candidatus Omnitrophica bacterium]|nr:DUF1732 domain-containing protein [Candidatus Omnitrophota bacterium]
MIRGMSGFGQSEAENSKLKVTVQVRTLNHRYLDYAIYLPESLRWLEAYLKTKIKGRIKRGKVTVSFNITNKAAISPNINPDVISAYTRLARELKRRFGISGDISFSQAINLPKVLKEPQGIAANAGTVKNLIASSLGMAIEAVVQMRRKEGVAIYRDLKERAAFIKSKISFIEREFPKIFLRAKKRLSKEELVSFKRSADVSEELVRLKFHLANFSRTACRTNNESIGKELDFISQELQREVNTLGAKVPDKLVSYAVVKIKSQLEKIREQLQNVE